MAQRVIYGQKGATIGGTAVTAAISFTGECDLAAAGEDVFVFGQHKKIGTLYSAEIPCTATVGWYLGFGNEGLAGLTGTNVASNFITNPTDVVEVATSFSNDGVDGGTGTGLTFTGCVVSSYTATLSVGEIPSAECEFTCTGLIGGGGGSSVPPPATGAPVLRPEDVIVSIGPNAQSIAPTTFCAQSVTINATFAREDVRCLGQLQPIKFVQFPLTASITVSMNTTDYNAPDFTSIVDGTGSAAESSVSVSCSGTVGSYSATLNGATVAQQSISASLDGAETMDVTYEASIGAANDITSGLSIS